MKNDLHVDHNSILYYNDRVIIPTSLKQQALQLLHQGHMGIVKTKSRASQSMYWINLNNDLENYISKCYICEKYQRAKTNESMLSHDIPNLPFEQIGLDIMTCNNKDFLVVIDYFSKWIEIHRLKNKHCSEIISKLKMIFSNFGIPQKIISDNSPFNSKEIRHFCTSYKIEWIYSSPNYPKSNGMAEKAVAISKNIIKKSQDLKSDFLDLLSEYRATKIPSLGLSPSEILLGRLIRTKIPVENSKLKPITAKARSDVKYKLKKNQTKSKEYYDQRSRPEENFKPNQKVLLFENGIWVPGIIVKKLKFPRSYLVKFQSGKVLRRNSKQIKKTKVEFSCDSFIEQKTQSFAKFDDFYENRKGGDSREISENSHFSTSEVEEPNSHESSFASCSENEELQTCESIGLSNITLSNSNEGQMTSSPVCNQSSDSDLSDLTLVPSTVESEHGRPQRIRNRPLKFSDYDLF